MSQAVEKKEQSNSFMSMLVSGTLRIIVSLVIPLLAFVVLAWSVTYMTNADAPKAIRAVVALVIGVGGIWVLYIAFDNLVSFLPLRMREGVRPFVFVGPALVIISVYLVYPALDTIIRSFKDARSVNFIGLDNYKFIFTDPNMLIVLRNNLLWLVLVTSFAVGLGLVIAVMVDRIRWESAVKSIIFLPMAISAVGASVIWKFIYTFRPAGRPQIGLLNAIWVALGGDPQGWLILIIIYIWILVGFAMVVISAAVKGVPNEQLEAARIDGATEIQTFFKVIIPNIRGTLLTVTTTILIMVLKVFDIVYVMTSGHFNTQVIANSMFVQMFTFRQFGRASALAVILLIGVIPVMIYNVRSLREGRS
jgi:alpha-glucoside transport system permease protein